MSNFGGSRYVVRFRGWTLRSPQIIYAYDESEAWRRAQERWHGIASVEMKNFTPKRKRAA